LIRRKDMSFTNPAFLIPRRPVFQPFNEAGVWDKMSPMFPQATQSPPTPEFLDLNNLPLGVKANPVQDILFAAGFAGRPNPPHTLEADLMSGVTLPGWDGTPLTFFLFRHPRLRSPFNGPQYPAPTIRVPNGAIFHAKGHGHGPPPHTIHWHGIEPTSINDGVGHCSQEIGTYIYQWQPNAIGSYFYHCHRQTVQHFEFGLFGFLVIHPPDAFFASIRRIRPNGRVVLNNVPIGAGRDKLFRTAANLVTPIADFTIQFPGFIGGDPKHGVFVPDPRGQFPTDPHAFTVPYDVEAIWVMDDRDSTWSNFAPDPFAFFPRNGNQPGVNDKFKIGFFNDHNADFWFITGVPVPGPPGSRVAINPAGPRPAGGGLLNGLIPPQLNSGVAGTQVAINAKVNQTILIRALDAAYNNTRITFPVDVLIIAVDGRALGVPPFGLYNSAFLLPQNTPILLGTARRFDALMRFSSAAFPTGFRGNATVEFIDTQGTTPDPRSQGVPLGPVVQTALIPIRITP
jgi:hypothetical protein